MSAAPVVAVVAKPHQHSYKCITQTWRPCFGLCYEEWLAVAADHPNQDLIWKAHERYGRLNEQHKRAFDEVFDLGGEG